MWGINSNKVRSPSSSIDVFEGVVGIGSGNNGREGTKSLSDISSVADLLGSLGTGRSSRSENNRANQRRRHSNSFESNSAMGMYMLDEEEQWAMVLIREIKFALIEIRNVIFGRDNSSGSKSNPSSPKNIVNREESSNSLTLADKVSALTFNGEDIKIDTSEMANGTVSFNTDAIAGLGSDVITFGDDIDKDV